MALTEKLSAIGEAIRAKTGKEDLLTLDEMPTEIASIETGGGGGADLPEEALVITGNCNYRFANGGWDWFIKEYGDKITTKDINELEYMFEESKELELIPFDINTIRSGSSYNNVSNLFKYCEKLKTLPYLKNLKPNNFSGMFNYCYMLREIPQDWCDTWDWSYLENATSNSYGASQSMLDYCYSLRSYPKELLTKVNPLIRSNSANVNYLFRNCFALDEITDIGTNYTGNWTSNAFGYSFQLCRRLARLTFQLKEDGTPAVVNWKAQTINLSSEIGYTVNRGYADCIYKYNSGITQDKEVYDDESYNALKDNSDWYATHVAYSRYNHDSAVETINTLPDTSAYLASAGGTNTIKFKGNAGALTDGGAINTLTTEEIAVATAKGWTVTLV